MAWTAIKTWLPEETITASDLNTYLRDNMNETILARPASAGGGFAVVSNPNEVTMRTARVGNKSTTSTTTSTAAGGVSVGPAIATVAHSGAVLVMFKATIRIQTAGALASYGVGLSTGTLCSTSRAVRSSDTVATTLSAHYIAYDLASPASFDGFLWTSNGANTAEVTDAVVTIQPL